MASYPDRDITFIIPYGPGGTTDPISRILMDEVSKTLDVNFVAINRPGASATLGTQEIVKAAPDGYTIGLTNDGAAALQPQIASVPYGRPNDYQPIVKIVSFGSVLAVNKDSPLQTLADFTEEARRRPGQVSVGLSGALSPSQFALFNYSKKVGIELNYVPFSGGGGEVMTNLLGGRIDAAGATPGTAKAHVDAGNLRLLGVLPGDRLPIFPDAPSFKEQGFDFPTPENQYFIIGPKGMDPAIVAKLEDAFLKALHSDAFQAYARDNGMRVDALGAEDTKRSIDQIWDMYAGFVEELDIPVQK